VRIWIELSGEHPTLPRAEALAAFEAERVRTAEMSWSTKLLRAVVEGNADRALARIGLAHYICEEIGSGTFDDVLAAAETIDVSGKRFRIRARGLLPHVEARAAERGIGAEIARRGKVDLAHPDVEFRLLVGEAYHLGRVLYVVDRSSMEARKVTHRPFSLPISLHPKLARAIVNLARVQLGGRLLDPFSGTGGIVLEAGAMGLRAIGADVRRSMVVGARSALRRLGTAAEFVVADAGRGPWAAGVLDGVATDPPYGRAASTKGENPLALYDRAFASIADSLPTGAYAAVVLPTEKSIDVVSRHLELVERHSLRVHKSLTRTFCAFVKPRSG
jgi:tRNA (guanine10-N2)-dimethyltransferase